MLWLESRRNLTLFGFRYRENAVRQHAWVCVFTGIRSSGDEPVSQLASSGRSCHL